MTVADARPQNRSTFFGTNHTCDWVTTLSKCNPYVHDGKSWLPGALVVYGSIAQPRPEKDVSYPEFLDEVLRAEAAPAIRPPVPPGVPRLTVAAAAAIRCATKPSLATAAVFSTNG